MEDSSEDEGASGASCPARFFLAAYLGAFAALGGQHVRVAVVGVAPDQVGVQVPGPLGVVRAVRVSRGSLAQRPELRRAGSRLARV